MRMDPKPLILTVLRDIQPNGVSLRKPVAPGVLMPCTPICRRIHNEYNYLRDHVSSKLGSFPLRHISCPICGQIFGAAVGVASPFCSPYRHDDERWPVAFSLTYDGTIRKIADDRSNMPRSVFLQPGTTTAPLGTAAPSYAPTLCGAGGAPGTTEG
jgi:hypothetical protein